MAGQPLLLCRAGDGAGSDGHCGLPVLHQYVSRSVQLRAVFLPVCGDLFVNLFACMLSYLQLPSVPITPGFSQSYSVLDTVNALLAFFLCDDPLQ